jgi:hypothetical protein
MSRRHVSALKFHVGNNVQGNGEQRRPLRVNAERYVNDLSTL